MKKAAIALALLAGLVLTGCYSGSGEVRYVNRANSSETLTLNRARNVKTKVIYTFHGVSNGSYTLKTEKGTTRGTFSSDGDGIKFRPQDGEAQSVKINKDGSFDFAQGTWQVAPLVMEKSLKAVASTSNAGKAQ